MKSEAATASFSQETGRGCTVMRSNRSKNCGGSLTAFILKEGKEYNQGVAYLDDGTMVVVDNARRLIGKNADIAVTSVLQTTAGKMIFGRLWEESDGNGGSSESRANGVRRTTRDLRTTSVAPTRISDQGETITE